MENNFIFPTNPFEDVRPSDFNKLNKKNVSEDFVEENFKLLKWKVYKPFSDTGVDRILLKDVCPNNHTPLNENLDTECMICGSKPIRIVRFLQVKTRQLKYNVFGYTLKSKDIRIDPRHVFLLYSDGTTITQQDFFILPNKEYFNFFKEHNLGGFSNTSFRKGNNKLNSLKYDGQINKWKWGRHSFEHFRNKSGLILLQDTFVDINLDSEILELRNTINSLVRKFSKGTSFSNEAENLINKRLTVNLNLYETKDNIISVRQNTKKHLEINCNNDTLASMNRYFEFIKRIEVTGESQEDEDYNE